MSVAAEVTLRLRLREVGERLRPIGWWVTLLVAAAAAGAELLLPTGRGGLVTVLGACAVGLVVLGVRVHRPSVPLPWFVFAVAIGFTVFGDVVYDVLTGLGGQDKPFPSIADVFYLATYPCLLVGLRLVAEPRGVRRTWGGFIDASTVAATAGLLAWIFLISPRLTAQDLSWGARTVQVAYTIGDVLVLAMAARLLFGGRRDRIVRLLALSAFGLLAADVLAQCTDLYGPGGLARGVGAAWLVFCAGIAAAALHPAVGELEESDSSGRGRLSSWWVLLLSACNLVGPAALVIAVRTGSDPHTVAVACFSGCVSLTVIARMVGIVVRDERAVRSERALRTAGERLVSARGVEEIYRVAISSVASVVGAKDRCVAGLYLVGPTGVYLAHGTPVVSNPTAALEDGTNPDGRLVRSDRVSVSPMPGEHGLRGVLVVRSWRALPPEASGVLGTLAAAVALALESAGLIVEVRQRQHEAHFKSLVHNSSDVILVVDRDGLISFATPSLQRTLGWELADVLGVNFSQFVHPDDAMPATRLLAGIVTDGAQTQQMVDWRVARRDGGYLSFEVMFSNLIEDPDLSGVVFTMRNVTERRVLEDQLRHQTFHDSLTGLANRALLHDHLEHALSRLSRRGGFLALVVFDLDDFKLINDTLGHAVGDELIGAVAGRLRRAGRSGDTVARLGGDEFAVLVEDVGGSGEAERIAEALLGALDEPVVIGEQSVRVSASGGLVVVDGGAVATPITDVMRHADLALYAAKDRGKAQVVAYYDDLHARMVERVTRTSELQRAIEVDQFFLQYQPIVSIQTGAVVGAEALVRWHHPYRGTVPPAEFIQLAEDTGMIIDLGRWVLVEACRQARAWAEVPGGALRMSINVSGRQLQEEDFPGHVAEALAESGLEPGALVLELTESVLIHQDSGITDRLQALHDLGVQLAIDDFGVGYAGMGYLQTLPIDILKIDKSLVDNLGVEGSGGALAQAAIWLAHSLNLEVVAEGIERVEQRDELWALGCGHGQGFLFARPLYPADLVAVLADTQELGPPLPRASGSPLLRPRTPVPTLPDPSFEPGR